MSSVLFALFTTLCQSIDSISWKKALSLAPKMQFFTMTLLGIPVGVLLCIGLIIVGDYHAPLLMIGLVALANLIYIVREPILQRIWREEKVSLLMPYENVNTFLVTLFAFCFLGHTTLATFLVACAALVVITLGSIDYKDFSVPRHLYLILLSELLTGIANIIVGYTLLHMTNTAFYIWDQIPWAVMIFVGIAWMGVSRSLGDLRSTSREFWAYRMTSTTIGTIAWYSQIIIIADCGLVVSTLLGFLQLIVMLGLSSLVLHEKPERRDIILASIVTPLAIVGAYLNT